MTILFENIKYIYNSLSNSYNDRVYGIETVAEVQVYDLGVYHENVKHAKKYQATNYGLLRKIFRKLDIDYSKYTLYDVGAGKGRALFVGSLYPFKKCVGVEFGEKVFKDGLNNLESFKLRKDNISLVNGCASTAPYSSEPCVYFMYNPFDEVLMKSFLEKVKENKHEDDIIVYVNPRKVSDFKSFGWNKYKAFKNKNFNRVVYFYNCL